MAIDRSVQLTPQELALKLATREAVEAAGGQIFVARELGRTQSRISDWCSEHTADFMPLPLIVRLEALGAGQPGNPHITRALARARGVTLASAERAPPAGMDDLGDWLGGVAREAAGLMEVLAQQDLSRGAEELSQSARQNIHREAGELTIMLEQLRRVVAGDGVVPIRRSDTS